MTQKQRIYFFKLFARACHVRGIPPAERDAFRHRLIAQACPLSGGSLRLVGSGEDFDRLMRLVAREAQSVEAAGHFATAEGRRWAYLIESAARQVAELYRVSGMPAVDPMAYILGIIKQAKLGWAMQQVNGEWWLDLTDVNEAKLLMMLDTHRRRLLRLTPLEKTEEDGTRMHAGFDADAAYRRVGNRLVRVVGTTEPTVMHCHFTASPGGAKTKNPAVARSRTALQSRRNRPPLPHLERC